MKELSQVFKLFFLKFDRKLEIIYYLKCLIFDVNEKKLINSYYAKFYKQYKFFYHNNSKLMESCCNCFSSDIVKDN